MNQENRTCWSTLQERMVQAKQDHLSLSQKRQIALTFAESRRRADARYLDPTTLPTLVRVGYNIVRSNFVTTNILAPLADFGVEISSLPLLINQGGSDAGGSREWDEKGRGSNLQPGGHEPNSCCTIPDNLRPRIVGNN